MNKTRKTFSTISLALASLMLFAAVAFAATITGSDEPENLPGTNRADTINANGGNDTVRAKRGHDTVDAGAGDDKVYANDGRDSVVGGDGNDVLHGGWGHDKQWGGNGDDTIFANRGRDESWGGPGNDQLWALARGDRHGRNDTRGDTLHGEDGDDTFRTRDGEVDLIDCGPGNDTAHLDFKDRIVDATSANKNGSCETVIRKSRFARDTKETANP